ncbi:MAG TPA: SIMPL domain-containing protein [Terriglobales bacterium]|nr:SIMPL domain-containing protein [Terriglobales bacterium]
MKNLLFVVASTGLLFAQDIQVNRQNKTIAVTAEASTTADAEVAGLEIGYHNFGLTQDAAFQENVRAAGKITKALLDAKVPKGNIETEKLRLARTEFDEKWTAEMKKERQFTADQSWHVTVSASEAQAVVDLVVDAGANEVDDVDWNVTDPVALQAKAGGAALAKARAIADQMAKGLGTKLGELVYASNRAPIAKMWGNMTLNTETAALSPVVDKQPKLTLFPQQVKSDATVYAVFSIE